MTKRLYFIFTAFMFTTVILFSCNQHAKNKDGNAFIISLVLTADGNNVPLVPEFSPYVTEYSADVYGENLEIIIVPEAAGSKAEKILTPQETGKIGGKQEICITVTAEDGTVKNYTVKLTRNIKYSETVLVPVPEGGIEFPIGTDDKGGGINENSENKKTAVVKKPFRAGRYEVTYALWKAVFDWAKENGYTFKKEGFKGGAGGDAMSEPERANDSGSVYQPVTKITSGDMIVWCNAYSEITGRKPVYWFEGNILKTAEAKTVINSDNIPIWSIAEIKDTDGYRLPDIYEWELAARWQGTEDLGNSVPYLNGSTVYYFTKGDSASGSSFHVWKDIYMEPMYVPEQDDPVWDKIRTAADETSVYSAYSDRGVKFVSTGVLSTGEVGTRKPNALGIFDMSGNVCERCSSFKIINEKKVNFTSFRGGAWDSYPNLLRIGYSDWMGNFAQTNQGFRVVCTEQ